MTTQNNGKGYRQTESAERHDSGLSQHHEEPAFAIFTTATVSVTAGAVLPHIGREGDADQTEPEQLLRFLRPYPAAAMEAYPISGLVNRPGNDIRATSSP